MKMKIFIVIVIKDHAVNKLLGKTFYKIYYVGQRKTVVKEKEL